MYKVGLVGAGGAGQKRATAIMQEAQTQLALVCDADRAAAAALAARTGAEVMASWQDLVEADLDIVVVSTTHDALAMISVAALAAGKHVLCEKPLASNAKQAVEMFDTATSCDRLLVEAFMYRSHPQTHAIIQKIKQGAIGRVLLVRTSFCYCTQRIADNIRFDASLDGGALMDIGCYCIDFARLMIWLARRCNLNVEHWRV